MDQPTARSSVVGNLIINSPAQSLDSLKTIIKSQLLDRIRTNDPILDTLIAFLLLSSQDVLMRYICKFKDHVFTKSPALFYFLLNFVRYRVLRRSQRVVRTAKIQYITESREINTLFAPVMWYINQISEIEDTDEVQLHSTKDHADVVAAVPQNQKSTLKILGHDIECVVYSKTITIYADREHTRENAIIHLSTLTANPNILKQFVELCNEKYDEYQKKKKWVQTIYRNNRGSGRVEWSGQPTKCKKLRQLQTVILKESQMEDFIDDLNKFLHDENWYLSRDVPYTRGYMFFGPPGTGKSSCIKALAGYTKRHLHYLLLGEIRSDNELFQLLEKINYDETILVIEDIDCFGVTGRRDEAEKNKDKTRSNGDDEENDEETEDHKSGHLSLSGLLNFMDGGIIDSHGRIMVITTNHPERLDDALVRPGRIDMKINFDLCDSHQILGLFKNFFGHVPGNAVFPDHTYSPAEITSMLIQHKNDVHKAWEKLLEISVE